MTTTKINSLEHPNISLPEKPLNKAFVFYNDIICICVFLCLNRETQRQLRLFLVWLPRVPVSHSWCTTMLGTLSISPCRSHMEHMIGSWILNFWNFCLQIIVQPWEVSSLDGNGLLKIHTLSQVGGIMNKGATPRPFTLWASQSGWLHAVLFPLQEKLRASLISLSQQVCCTSQWTRC